MEDEGSGDNSSHQASDTKDTHDFEAVAGMVRGQYDAFKKHLLGVERERKGLYRLRVCIWDFGCFLWYDQREQWGLYPRASVCHRGIPADQEKIERSYKEKILEWG